MLNEQRLVDLFCRLVRIDSPSFGEREMCDFVKAHLEAIGLSAVEDGAAKVLPGTAGNLLVKIPGTLVLPPLLLCAHMDTVEPARGKRAVLRPDRRITSAGDTVLGADDLAGLAAILEAAASMLEDGAPHRPLELLITAAEEPYCAGAGAFDFGTLESKEAFVFDLDGDVGLAANRAPTILSFTAEIQGRAAHAGFSPESGVHAVRIASEVISKMRLGRSEDEQTTVNVGTISGGTANNIVPERCVFTGEIRSFSDEAAEAELEKIRDLLARTASRMGGGAILHSKKHVKAYCTRPDSPAVQHFFRAAADAGLTPRLTSTFGGSDMNHLAQHGISGLVVANAMRNVHSVSENTSVDELMAAARLALSLMLLKE